MKIFKPNLDLNNRQKMLNYLNTHFRYHTANSWNNLNSYANNLKIYSLDLPLDVLDSLWDLIDCDNVYDPINELIYEFNVKHNYKYQAAFNGRSGGYLVLYTGGTKPSGYQSYCPACGQGNFKPVTSDKDICGVCGNPRMNYQKPHMTVYTEMHSNMFDTDDLEDIDFIDLKTRCQIVLEFDELCDNIVAEAINIARSYKPVTKTIYVPKTIRVVEKI